MSKFKSVGIALALVLLQASTALAAEGELRWADFGWRVLNAVIFVAVLWKLSGKKLVGFLTGRQDGIRQDLEDLDLRREEAKKKLAEVEASIANLEAERKAILDESRAQAEAGKQAIIDEANRQAEQIIVGARRTAENEGRAVIAEVRAALADEIVDAAEKILEKKLDASKHGKLIDNSLTKVVLN